MRPDGIGDGRPEREQQDGTGGVGEGAVQMSSLAAAGPGDGEAHMPRVEVPGNAQSRVAVNAVARAAGEAVAKVASLAFYIVLARELGHEQYGAFVFALALTGTLLIASGFGTDDLVARRVARDHALAGPDLA